MDSLYPESYEASRARFLRDVEPLRVKWASSRLERHPLKNFPDLSIDWLWAEPERKEHLVIVSTAEHGIEGYVGSAMLKIFMDKFAPRLNPQNTGLLLIHTINPWGMKYHKRVNPNHVDLNRNFVFDGNYDPNINPDYRLLSIFLNPRRKVRPLYAERLPFLVQVIRNMISPGRARVQAASLLGQHIDSQGIYFGGFERQEETEILMGLYRQGLQNYQDVLQIDMHTGYGPRDQMTIIIPPTDPITSAEASRKFKYPLVQKIDAKEFYAISGDMGEYVYRLHDREFPGSQLLVCGFEFGTFGDSLPALIRSLHITILENQMRHHGAVSSQAEEQIHEEYRELFLPAETKWRDKAIADGRQAFQGILSAYELL
jgi:hypothetical protein